MVDEWQTFATICEFGFGLIIFNCSSKECAERLFFNSVHRKMPECIERTTLKFVKKLHAFPVWPMPLRRYKWRESIGYIEENTSIAWHSILYALSVLETHHLQRWNPKTTQVAEWKPLNLNIKSCGVRSLASDLGIGPLILVSFVKISSVTNPESYRHAGPGRSFPHRNTGGRRGHNSRVVRHFYSEVPGLCRWEPTTISASSFSECSQAVEARCLSFLW